MNKRNYYGMQVEYFVCNKTPYATITMHHDALPKPYTITGYFSNKCFVVGCVYASVGITIDTRYKTRLTPNELGMIKLAFFDMVSIEKLYSLSISCRECYATYKNCHCSDCFGCTRFHAYQDFDNDNFRYAYIDDVKMSMVDYHMMLHTDVYKFCFDCMSCEQHEGYHYDISW